MEVAMSKACICLIAITLSLTAICAAQANSEYALSHPVHGHVSSPDFDVLYGEHRGYKSWMNQGDITFVDAHPYPEFITYVSSGAGRSCFR